MREQAAKRIKKCSGCDGECTVWMVQIHTEGKLKWEVDWTCDSCGTISHDGDWGWAPDYVRAALASDHGLYRVYVPAGGDGSGRLLKVFREAFQSSILEAKERVQELTSTGWCGTQIECLLIVELLEAKNVDSEMAKCSDSQKEAHFD